MGTRHLVLTLCFIGTVFQCTAAAGVQTTQDPSSTDVMTSPSTPQAATTTGPNSPDAGTTTANSLNSTESTGVSQTTDMDNNLHKDNGLSDGAIAGIVIGSIAGVALIGGVIFGALKYTGKI